MSITLIYCANEIRIHVYMCCYTSGDSAIGFRKTTSKARKDVQLIFEW